MRTWTVATADLLLAASLPAYAQVPDSGWSAQEDDVMPDLPRRYFNGRKSYADYFAETHAAGALDAKTKELMHLALVLALHCEP